MRVMSVLLLLLLATAMALGVFLFRPFLEYPMPARLTCLDASAGVDQALGDPGDVYGLGLSYAGHIAESPGLYDPETGPPIFRKRMHTVNLGDEIVYPSREVLLQGVREIDPGHAENLAELFLEIPALLDYEVEIGLKVLSNISLGDLRRPDFAPPVGYFVANDITARILIGMAPRFEQTVAYLAEGKGLPGFLPIGNQVWVPLSPAVDSWPCVELRTEVNGEVRQSAASEDIIMGPRAILLGVAEGFNLNGFKPGDWVITGTPPGVAAQIPGWIQRSLLLVDPDAETKLDFMIGGSGSDPAYLRPGDVVTVSAGFLGSKTSRIVR
jgi:2-keto-4-pentenoate hydratase/2-oxohepta-3-ene-1,7-dioic acid hydratase in catechol pathway